MTAADAVPPDDGSPDDDLLAAELALGLADGPARSAGEARLTRDPEFAAAHGRWTVDALSLCRIEAVEPDAGLWLRIRDRLPVNDGLGSRQAPPARRAPAVVGAAAAFLAGLFGGHLWQPRPALPVPATVPAPLPRPRVAVLTGTAAGDGAVAVSLTDGDDRLAAVPAGVDPGRRVTEYWVIPAGGKPVALGVLPHDRPSARPIAAALRPLLRPGATLAVSLEPAGGSPTGQPTGPVILTGTVAAPS